MRRVVHEGQTPRPLQDRDEAVGLEDVGAMLTVGCDLLQQPVAFPQVGAGVGL